KPHLTSDDASRADCVRALLFSGLRRMKFRIDKFLKSTTTKFLSYLEF
ncbi:hypothetical protein CAMGR0001_1912, partial [Campylobacter gracilis RM3268]